MRSSTVNIASGSLFLSSLVSLVSILRTKLKSRLVTPISILTIFDNLTSVLFSGAFLYNFNNQNSSKHEESREDQCNSSEVFARFCVFLMPFANAFLYLVNLSLQCDQKISKLGRKLGPDPEKNSRSLKHGNFRLAKNVAWSLTSQLLIPIILAAVVSLTSRGRMKIESKPMDQLMCDFSANFPFDDCFDKDFQSNLSWAFNNYLASDDKLLFTNKNSSTQVDEILTRIWTVLNSTEPRNVMFMEEDVQKKLNCFENRCVVPEKFLKIYFLGFLVFVYFVPILVSTILLERSKYKCRTILKSLVKKEENEDINRKYFENEAKNLSSFFRMTFLHFYLAIILWTPLFVQILSKIFLCSEIPRWAMEVSFFGAVMAGIVKNILNVFVIKIEESNNALVKKFNSVHPELQN